MKVGHTSEFLFGIYTNKIILIFKMLQFFKNIKKNTWRYYFTSAYQKSWYDLQFLRHWAWWTEICNFRSLFAFFTPFKTKKLLDILSFYSSVPKIPIKWCKVPEIQNRVRQKQLLSFWAFLALLMILKIKFWKNGKKCLEILTFYKCVP